MLSILIADDNHVERMGVKFLIQKYRMDLKTYEFGDGESAFNFLKKQPIDILLTDIKMPFMDGLSLAREARNLYPEIKIIILSGYGEFEYAKKAISLGAVNYLLKPVNPSEFESTMNKVIDERKKERFFDDTRYISTERGESHKNSSEAVENLMTHIKDDVKEKTF